MAFGDTNIVAEAQAEIEAIEGRKVRVRSELAAPAVGGEDRVVFASGRGTFLRIAVEDYDRMGLDRPSPWDEGREQSSGLPKNG